DAPGSSCRAATTRPRPAGGPGAALRGQVCREFVAPLDAALLVAARRVLPLVAVVALRQLRPRPAGGPGAAFHGKVSREFVAPLDAALLVAARRVPPLVAVVSNR